ncbi:coniferyl-alcohol glucosyltransferase [Ranunculus cassubicifolius]
MEIPKPRILILTSPGMGHLIPLLELAKRLVSLETLHVTLLIVSTSTSAPQSQLVKLSSQFHQDLQIVDLTPAEISDIVSTNLSLALRLHLSMIATLPTLKSHIASMELPVAALIVDIFGLHAFKIADEFKIPKYLFVTPSAWFFAVNLYLPTLDKEIEGEYTELTEPIRIPGVKPIRPTDLFAEVFDRKIQLYKEHLKMCERMSTADGILLNSWEDLEPQTINALRDNDILRQITDSSIYPVGPVIRSIGANQIGNECLDWLRGQPNESVLYVSFGSGGTLSLEQMTEVAWGLELSQQRFVWVVRLPMRNDDSCGSFFSSQTQSEDPLSYLPQGFSTRIKGQGLLVDSWAPQAHILADPSIGGFLSHCGWNSSLESITNGVPMIAWPLYAEQRLNAAALVEDFGIAVRSDSDVLPSTEVIGREEIAQMVRYLMESNEGKRIRDKAKDIKKGAMKAIDEGGSSYKSLLEVSEKWIKTSQGGC